MNTALATHKTNQVGFSAFDLMMDETVMARFERTAEIMAGSRMTVPKHLQGNVGDCIYHHHASCSMANEPLCSRSKNSHGQ